MGFTEAKSSSTYVKHTIHVSKVEVICLIVDPTHSRNFACILH